MTFLWKIVRIFWAISLQTIWKYWLILKRSLLKFDWSKIRNRIGLTIDLSWSSSFPFATLCFLEMTIINVKGFWFFIRFFKTKTLVVSLRISWFFYTYIEAFVLFLVIRTFSLKFPKHLFNIFIRKISNIDTILRQFVD